MEQITRPNGAYNHTSLTPLPFRAVMAADVEHTRTCVATTHHEECEDATPLAPEEPRLPGRWHVCAARHAPRSRRSLACFVHQSELKDCWSAMKVTLVALLTVLLAATTDASDKWLSQYEGLSFSDPIEIEEDDENRWWCRTKLGGQFTVSPTKVGLAEGWAALYYSITYPSLFEYFALIFEAPFRLGRNFQALGNREFAWPVSVNWEGTHENRQVTAEFGAISYVFPFKEEHLILRQLLEGGNSSLTLGLEVLPHNRDLTAVFQLEGFADRVRKARDLCHFYP